MYNSAVFDTLSSHTYNAYTVSKEFISGAPYNIDELRLRYGGGNLILSDDDTRRLDSFRNHNSDMKLKPLDSKKCLSTYGTGFANSKYKDLLAVSPVSNATNSLLAIGSNQSPSYNYVFDSIWGCAVYDNCFGRNDTRYFLLMGYPIEYCLVQEVDEKFLLQFSLPVMLIIIICNLIKIVCMILTVLGEGSRPLVTVGDAIASFLKESDPATKNLCLAGRHFF